MRAGKVRLRLDEDELYSEDVRRLVLRRHNLFFVSEDRHWVVNGREVDVVLWARTPGPRPQQRTIGFELKLYKLDQALEQARERRGMFHYFYLVVNVKAHDAVSFYAKHVKRGDWPGVGLITVFHREPILLVTSRYNPAPTSSLHRRTFLTDYAEDDLGPRPSEKTAKIIEEMLAKLRDMEGGGDA